MSDDRFMGGAVMDGLAHKLEAAFPKTSLFFLGLGFYRAWISVVLNHGTVEVLGAFEAQDLFDIAMIAVLLVCAVRSPKTPSLLSVRHVKAVVAGVLVVSTALVYLGYFLGPATAWASVAGSLVGGGGIALAILLWSELYSTLSPVRICLYYTASLAVCVGVIWICNGFMDQWLPVMTSMLPLVSLVMLSEAVNVQVSSGARVDHSWMRFSFPWMPVVFVALYALAYGLEQGMFSRGVPRAHESLGTLACCCVVLAGIVFLRSRVEFGTIYGSCLPFMAAVFLALPVTGALPEQLSSASACWGYAANEIFVMTMIGSIAYRYGANPVWLFGIERTVRAAALLVGWHLSTVVDSVGWGPAPFVVLAVIVATFMAVGQNKLDAWWGVSLVDNVEESDSSRSDPAHDEARRQHDLAVRVSELARRYSLSQREEEVLLLLAQHKTTADLERELVIANGTAKAHTRHVYAKLDIHSRDELFALVGVEPTEAAGNA